MNLGRTALLHLIVAAALMAPFAKGARGQERPAKRVADIVGVALAEYEKGIDASGRLLSSLEYEEAVSFLATAREAAQRLSGTGADSTRLALDSISVGVARRVPPRSLDRWRDMLLAALGADAALDLPTKPVDLAAGERLYAQHCASCHGPRGMGDGPAGKGIVPPPPALGSAAVMRDVPPALMYRIISVGIAGTQMVGWANQLSADERWSIVSWLNGLRGPDAGGMAAGEGLWLQRCASCHGVAGGSNGPMSANLSRLPREVSSFAWQAERSDAQIAAAIRDGVAGTPMPAARDVTDTEIDGLVAFVRSLSIGDAPGAVTGGTDPDSTIRSVMRHLQLAMASARSGRQEEADDHAFDAYITFEPMETPARARSPGTVAALERHFADFKGAIAARDLRSAERSMNAIEQGLPGVKELARPPASGWGAFLQSLLIILREGLEAILVIGAVVAFLVKTGHRERLRSIWTGVLLALGASALTAVVMATVLRALPATREVIEGATMLVAVAVLFSVSYWLISKVEAARWQRFIREKVDVALQHGGGTALALVAFLAVYREGAETALFYQALLNEGSGILLPLLAGVVVGGGVLAVIFTLFWKYGIKIPLRPFFAVTSVLLYYMAFVFMGKGVRELQEGGVVGITVLPGWPHVDAMGIFPSVETLLAQLLLLILFAFALLKTFWPSRSVALPTVASDGAELRQIIERLEAIEARLGKGNRESGIELRDS
ncbi:MAG TPA: cytochrome c/FTR1 family iron permease [Gemmatimonadaceae bacterium]